MRFFLIFAMLFTIPSLLARAEEPRVLFVVGMASEAAIAQGDGAQVVVGAENGEHLRAVLDALDPAMVRSVISFGVAGALDPAFKPGDLALAGTVGSPNGSWGTSPELNATLNGAFAGAGLKALPSFFYCADGFLAINPAERAALRARTGAGLSDMESQIAAEFAATHHLPFAAIRAILDPADFTLPPATLLPLNPDGTPDKGAIAWSVATQPWQIPDLQKVSGFEKLALNALKRARGSLDLSRLRAQQ